MKTRLPHQSVRHGYRRHGVPARMARAPHVETDAQCAYRLDGAALRRSIRAEIYTALLLAWRLRKIPPQTRRPSQHPHRRHQSQRRINGPHTKPRRASGIAIAPTTPRFARRRYACWVKKPGAGIANAAIWGQRSRCRNSLELPPPGAGVSGLSSPIFPDLRISLNTARSLGETITPPHQTQHQMKTRVPHQSARHGYRGRGASASRARAPLVIPTPRARIA